MVAITAEPVGTVTSSVFKDAKFWIGSDPGRASMARYSSGGVGIPHFYLVDHKGQVVSDNYPTEQMIEDLLAKVFSPEIDRELTREVGEARKAYESGRVGAAWKLAGELEGSGEENVQADAKYLREKAETWVAEEFGEVERLLAAGEAAKAYGRLLVDSFRFEGMPEVSKMTEAMAKLEAEDEVKKDKYAWKSLRAALTKETDAAGDESKAKAVLSAFKACAKKYPAAEAGRLAAEIAEKLGG